MLKYRLNQLPGFLKSLEGPKCTHRDLQLSTAVIPGAYDVTTFETIEPGSVPTAQVTPNLALQ